MAKPPEQGARGQGGKPTDREARLKAALQANMARRKAQARALAPRGAGDTGPEAAAGDAEPDGTPPHSFQDHRGARAPDHEKD